MKRPIVIPYLLGLLAAMFTWPQPGQADNTILIATEDYPPYVAPDLKHYGVLGQIVSEAFALENIKVEFGFFPDNRAYWLSETGKWDATMPWARRTERLPLFHYGEPLIESDREVFFYRRGFSFTWDAKKQDYRDIAGLHVGAIQGSNYGPKFQAAEREGIISVSRVTRTEQNLLKLSEGRIDLMITPERIAIYAMNKVLSTSERAKIRVALAIDEPVEYDYLLISKKSKRNEFFLKAMNNGLRKLKASGRHKAIIDAFMHEFGNLKASSDGTN